MIEQHSSLLQNWLKKKASLLVKANPYIEYPEEELWAMWEALCRVPPVRFALANVDLPSDVAQFAQVILSTIQQVPHVATYLVGTSLDFMFPKIRNKIMSWNIREEDIKWIPRKSSTLSELKKEGYRLVGTSAHEGKNALDFRWGDRDIAVIGGVKGLSQKNTQLLDEVVKIPCSAEVPFLTTPTVIPILTYATLHGRGLWN